jgi:uncharacterized membrane protein YqiK
MKFWLTFAQSLPHLGYGPQAKVKQEETLVATIEVPSSSTPVVAQFNGSNVLGIGASLLALVVVLLLLSVWAYTRVYEITPNNEAFVKTGGIFRKRKVVVLNGGCVVLPGFDEITRVPLREISIDVERTGNLAVRTQDYLRANMRVTFYVCINAKEEDILIAAARLSKDGLISEKHITEALEKRADDAIRAAAKRKTIAEIDSDKLGFADEVLNLIQQDLKKVGLTLNNIAISEIEESDTYDENNFFDAQGVKLRTETIQKSIQEKLDVELQVSQQKRELELNTQVAIEQKELAAEKQSLNIAKEKEEAKLNQAKEIEFLKAAQAREIQETQDQEKTKIETNRITQEKLVQEGEIEKQLSIEASQIAAKISLEERQKELKVFKALQEQEAEVAEINRQKTVQSSQLKAQVEVAAAEQESSTAKQNALIAIAAKEQERYLADAERTKAEESVSTAKEVEIAERESRLTLIRAQQEAQKVKISQDNVVEIEVFRRKRQAEIARQAAELEAESIRTLANANRLKAIAEAEGKLALIESENALSDANRTAAIIREIWPDLSQQLPDIIQALAPQPGILGDAKIYSFMGTGPNGTNEGGSGINKLLLSASGLQLINGLMEEGKLGAIARQIKELLTDQPPTTDESLESKISMEDLGFEGDTIEDDLSDFMLEEDSDELAPPPNAKTSMNE